MKQLVSRENLATLIIVHGAFEHAGRYDTLAEKFQHDGFNVIYGDLPGQGHSKGKKGHINRFNLYIDTVQSWVQQADPSRPIFLLGHSMGGTVVIRVMEELKPAVDGVILSSPATGILNGPGKPLEVFSQVINSLAPSVRLKAPFKPEYVTRNPEIIAQDKIDPLILSRVSIRWYKEFRKAIRLSFDKVEDFPNIPILVMQAGEDHMIDSAKSREWFSKVRSDEKVYKEWPRLYHEIFNEPEHQKVYDYALNFLQLQLKQLRKEE